MSDETPEIAAALAQPMPLEPELDEARKELVALINRITGGRDGTVDTPVAGLQVFCISKPDGPKHAFATPALGLIAQGSKRIIMGDDIYVYDPMHYLVTSVDLPVCGQVRLTSDNEPYLGVRLELALDEIGELIGDEKLPAKANVPASSRGMYVNRIAMPVLEPVLRLLRLLETPEDVPIMAPLIKREIMYRLLVNGEGARLRQIALQDSHTQRIAKAISALRVNYAQSLRVEDMARAVHMSVSSFHHHFKAVTAMSPLQYQKQLRLQEARRQMLMTGTDVASAAHSVGYESPSQFAREYGRMFGAPPLRDKQRWLSEAGNDAMAAASMEAA
ncbi:AraC-like DNA-binding protein [Variovorax boronicumulans]|uniref:AraC family transcriptional regulator n=1 Tax=Variovorax boronicumulans TaxID=436515 RepID=UPI002476650C|nr:AraC family transcriptional regulator [Variovorax boronicumulans]MDH6169924.1 AraC-like DNA-binding protein [Variovorax boronicumulans]